MTSGQSSGADDDDEETGFHIDTSFVEVSPVWLDRCRWSGSGFGRWARRENILILDARAWLKCVERPCKGVYGTGCRQLVLGDNMVLVLTNTVSLEITSFSIHRHLSSVTW